MVTRINGDFDNNSIFVQGTNTDNQDENVKYLRDMRSARMQKPDRFSKSGRKKKEDHFSVFRAGKEFIKGLFRPIGTLFKHPIIAIGSLVGLGALASVAPITIPILTVLGFGMGIHQTLMGIIKASVNYHLGDYKDAEKAFGDIAEGSVAVAGTSVAMKAAGSIAAEAKTTTAALKGAETGAEKLAAVEKGIDAGVKVQQGSWRNAFKQTHSVITNPRAVWSQLNPRTLYNTSLAKGQSLIGMFRNAPVLSQEEVTQAGKTAQAHLGLSDQDMPAHPVARSLNVEAPSHNLAQSEVRYGIDVKDGSIASHHGKAFYSALDDRLHIEANGFQHARNSVKRFPFLQKLMDHSPKPIQNFIGNMALKRISPERLFTQELSKQAQLRSGQLSSVGTDLTPEANLEQGRGLLPYISQPVEVTARNDANELFKQQILERLDGTKSNYTASTSRALRDARKYAVEKRLNQKLTEWNGIAASDDAAQNKQLKRIESKLQATRNLIGTDNPTSELLRRDQKARIEYEIDQQLAKLSQTSETEALLDHAATQPPAVNLNNSGNQSGSPNGHPVVTRESQSSVPPEPIKLAKQDSGSNHEIAAQASQSSLTDDASKSGLKATNGSVTHDLPNDTVWVERPEVHHKSPVNNANANDAARGNLSGIDANDLSDADSFDDLASELGQDKTVQNIPSKQNGKV